MTNFSDEEYGEFDGRIAKMGTYYIYMIELGLEGSENNDEAHFYIGKTDNIKDRLITHISRNRKTTRLIRDKKKKRIIAKVIAISEIHKIIFSEDEIDLLESKEDNKFHIEIDSITSKIENKFVYHKIVNKEGDIENNKQIYRGGHYTSEWDIPSESYKLKKISKYKSYEMESVLYKRYIIDDEFYEKYNGSQKKEYIEKIKKYIEENVEKLSARSREWKL